MGFLDKFFVNGSKPDKKKLQLIGATCLLIASKCEDVAYISTKDLAFCGDNTYKENHLVKMERKILSTLDFEIAIPTIHDFLATHVGYCTEISGAAKVNSLAYLFGEVALQSSFHLRWKMSTIAAAASALALVMHNEPGFPESLKAISGLEFDDVREPMEALWEEGVQLEQQNELVVIRKRYDCVERCHVGGYVFSTMGFDFAEEKAKM